MFRKIKFSCWRVLPTLQHIQHSSKIEKFNVDSPIFFQFLPTFGPKTGTRDLTWRSALPCSSTGIPFPPITSIPSSISSPPSLSSFLSFSQNGQRPAAALTRCLKASKVISCPIPRHMKNFEKLVLAWNPLKCRYQGEYLLILTRFYQDAWCIMFVEVAQSEMLQFYIFMTKSILVLE